MNWFTFRFLERSMQTTHRTTLDQLRESGVWQPHTPLRLHLGCGGQYFQGYVNIDYPQSEHNVLQTVADFIAEITQLDFPPQSVDEVRLHHVFEHFDRPTAIGLLIRWHQWLKPGGKLVVETPDAEVTSLLVFASDLPWREKQAALRHIFGSHEAHWAVHWDGWYKAKYEAIFPQFGFADLEFEQDGWKMIRQIVCRSRKVREIPFEKMIESAEEILRWSTVDDTDGEVAMWRVWCDIMKHVARGGSHAPTGQGYISAQATNISTDYDTVEFPSMKPKVSVVIPCYNAAEYLMEAVESVVAQTFTDWEIIIVNDGSTDSSLEIARQAEVRYFDRMIRVLDQPNAGVSAARNTAIRAADGEYILPLDADDKLAPEMLQKTVEYLDAHTDVSLCGSNFKHFGMIDSSWKCGPFTLEAMCRNNTVGYCTLYRKEVFERIGGYAEDMIAYEDWDFWISALEYGFVGHILSEELFFYRKHPESSLRATSDRAEFLQAKIIANHPQLYSDEGKAWANTILSQQGVLEKIAPKKKVGQQL